MNSRHKLRELAMILLMAACELDLETAPKAIVIDEAVTLAKKYCDDETYRLINGVLDRL